MAVRKRGIAMEKRNPKIPRIESLLGAGTLALLAVLCVYVMKPFASAVMWAVVLGFTLYPVQRRVAKWFKGRESWAALAVTLLAVLLVVGPLALIGLSLVDDGKKLAISTREQVMNAPDEPPGWLDGLPVIGDDLAGYWQGFVASREEWTDRLKKSEATGSEKSAKPETKAPGTVEKGLGSIVGQLVEGLRDLAVWTAVTVGNGLTQLTISLFLVFFILRDAGSLGKRLKVAVGRIAGEQGNRLLNVAGQTVKGVVYGYLGTSAAQGVMAGIGFMIAGVPGAVLLGALTFFMAVVPVGPPIIWGGAAYWLYMQDRTGWAIFMVIWGVGAISSVDNFLRPFLVSKGNHMPFALMFLGLVGGALAFGLIGVFLGPVLLAVAFRLIEEWTSPSSEGDEQAAES